MPNLMRLLPFLAALAICLSATLAQAADWTVSRSTKQVAYTLDKKNWTPVEGGMVVPNKAWISTGPRGRVTLERGPERVSFGPETLAAIITTNGFFTRKTDVVQQKGQLALDIEKRSRPHTYVHSHANLQDTGEWRDCQFSVASNDDGKKVGIEPKEERR